MTVGSPMCHVRYCIHSRPLQLISELSGLEDLVRKAKAANISADDLTWAESTLKVCFAEVFLSANLKRCRALDCGGKIFSECGVSSSLNEELVQFLCFGDLVVIFTE